MAVPQVFRGVRVPPGSRDWLLPLSDPRARPLRSVDIRIVGISEVRRGFEWTGPGANHLVLGSIHGSGLLEAQGARQRLRPGDLVLSPAGVARRFAAQAAVWKFLAIRLADVERWQHLRQRDVQPLPSHWLGRILAPVEGMLAEHPLGGAVKVHTQTFPVGGENPLEYLASRYGDRLARPGSDEKPWAPRPDAFELHATILRRQVEGMLATHPASGSDDEAVALASLWSRVVDRPRGPWDAEDLASALGVSRTTLYRMVKRQHGTSPAKLVERLRMDTACRLLSESRLSIEVIAVQVGYASAFSFSAAFKRVVGEPPSMFRRAAAEDTGRL